MWPSYRPKTHIHVRFQETATFKQVELRSLFNKLKRRHIRVPRIQRPATFVSEWALFRTLAAILGGALFSAAVAVGLNLLSPFATDSNLMFSMLAGFVVWVAVMVWCYTCNSLWPAKPKMPNKTKVQQFLRRLTHAHSWLGLVASTILFVIFFAGSVTLFKDEINQWAFQPHYSLNEGKPLPVSQILATAMQAKPFDPKGRVTLVMPSKHMPYYQLRTGLTKVVIDPTTGAIVDENSAFFLSTFIYRLHYELNVSIGYDLIGVITLFFLFMLVSGILIHARNLINRFFRYQPDKKKRTKLLDMHNLIGVMTLPFTLMYAVTGLLFNLLLIYQLAFVTVLYKGDKQALRQDFGALSINAQWQGKPQKLTDIDRLHEETVAKYQQSPSSIRLYNYGDKGAVVHFRGEQKTGFAQRYEVAYALENNQIVFKKDAESRNAVSRGMAVAAKLHFGNYAGTDLRLVYFLLGLGVCVLIVTGNLLWIDKKARQRNSSPKTVALVTNMTLLGSAGVVLATAVAFIFERTMPAELSTRSSILVYSFVATLGVSGIYLYFDKNKTRCLSVLMGLSALVSVMVVIIDWLMFGQTIVDLWHKGVTSIIATEIGLLCVAGILGFAAVKFWVRSRGEVISKYVDVTA
jgi:uncharacterized iron-regulated membrane protein